MIVHSIGNDQQRLPAMGYQSVTLQTGVDRIDQRRVTAGILEGDSAQHFIEVA
jgi:hypothetical protein